MFRRLTRILLGLVALAGLLWFLAPRIFNNAANSLLNSVNPSAAQAQGLAQFIPAGVTSQGKTGDLQIQLSGLTPNTSYEVTLDQGQCGQTGKDLGAVKTDGNGGFYNEFPLNSFDTSQTWFVDVRQQGSNGPSVACGQLQTNQTSSVLASNASQSGPDVFSGSQPLQNDAGQTPTPTSTPGGTNNTPPKGLPNTGANPGTNQGYDNNKYPRKY